MEVEEEKDSVALDHAASFFADVFQAIPEQYRRIQPSEQNGKKKKKKEK